jgi:hypothetical protein
LAEKGQCFWRRRVGGELPQIFSILRLVARGQDARENVRLEKWRVGADISLPPAGGVEVLVLDGGFSEGGEAFEPQSRLRLPADAALTARAGAGGCRVWVKTGHLARPWAVP